MKDNNIAIKEVALRLGLTVSQIHGFKNTGAVEFQKINRSVYFNEEQIEVIKESFEKKGAIESFQKTVQPKKPISSKKKRRQIIEVLRVEPLMVGYTIAAAMFDVDEATIYKWVNKEVIKPYITPTGSKRFLVDDLKNLTKTIALQ